MHYYCMIYSLLKFCIICKQLVCSLMLLEVRTCGNTWEVWRKHSAMVDQWEANVSVVCPTGLEETAQGSWLPVDAGWPYFLTLKWTARLCTHTQVCTYACTKGFSSRRGTITSALSTPTEPTFQHHRCHECSFFVAGYFMKEGISLLEHFRKDWLSLWHESQLF